MPISVEGPSPHSFSLMSGRRPTIRARIGALVLAAAVLAGCGRGGGAAGGQALARTGGSNRSAPAPSTTVGVDPAPEPSTPTTVLSTPEPTTTAPTPPTAPAAEPSSGRSGPGPGIGARGGPPPGPSRLGVTEVAGGLDTVWALAWDPEGRLWYTERGGRLTRLGEAPRTVAGVTESGEGGLMGLEIDGRGRIFVMYTSAVDNRIVRLEPDGSQTVLADGITKASIHNGGRLRLGPAGTLYAATGDAGQPALAPDPASRNGKVLRIDPDRGEPSVFSRGHRNIQGLCLAPGGPLMATEHGPDRGDEINVLSPGFDGGWPGTVGDGVRNYTPTIAPAGCAFYDSELIPEWRGSMLFVTLKGRDLRRLTFGSDGSVSGEEVLFDGEFGRLRDVAVGPDGAVYLTTSNRDGRGSPAAGDDRILRVAPAP